jgi:capsular polysaccharide biosynthesis protein
VRRLSWWSIVAAAAVAGLVAAAVATAAEPGSSRAETTLVLARGSEPLGADAAGRDVARTFASLVRTDTVAANVIRNLHLRESPDDLLDRVAVDTSGSALLRVRIEDDSADRARRIAQELTLVFTQLVKTRFASGDAASAIGVVVFDPAHTLDDGERGWAGNLAWGAVLGALVGAAFAPLRRRRL